MKIIYTIGYEGTDIDRFVLTLKAVGIRRLIDVRALALSRKKGFSKRALSARLMLEEIEYLHLVGLGDPKPGREAARAGRFDHFRSIYNEHLNSVAAQDHLCELNSFAAKALSCLLCFERDPVTCHRSLVTEKLPNFETIHLYGDEPHRYVCNTPKLPHQRSRESLAAAQC